ncbi:hypothetical protein [Caenispirillum bisanense]|uniref:Uncharacterized protein n=1 Tax=Caenispirillum bisanense TaxID=414052 RepID=A0A286GNB8_9PROT|nr:hypothetical protein [Caenispirillum bisanense]SOD97051.1 hypothetical protein SAMN05421508_106225 [Caenispirillum bisanense]
MHVAPHVTTVPDRGTDRLSTALDRAISDIDRAIAAHPSRDAKMVAADLARFTEYYPQNAEMYACLLTYITGSTHPKAYNIYRYIRVEDTHMRDIVDKLLAYDRVNHVAYDGYYCLRSTEHYCPSYLGRLPGVEVL